MKLLHQGSFNQVEKEVIELLKRKHATGKLSYMGKEYVDAQLEKNAHDKDQQIYNSKK